MPPQFLVDLSGIDLNHVLFGPDEIRQLNPHRGTMELLQGIIWADPAQEAIVGYKDITQDEFWVAGHIPGRPLFPGVLMIETAAQLASFYTKKYLNWTGFVGFAGTDNCRFRMQVQPGVRMHFIAKAVWHRHRRILCNTQGLVNGQLAFEGDIIGTQM